MPIVDTAGLLEAGTGYVMECTAPLEEVRRGAYLFWQFTGRTTIGDDIVSFTESFPVWLAGPLFKALEFPEVSGGRFDVEPALALGRRFKCDVVHEEVKGKLYARMKNMVPLPSAREADSEKVKAEDEIPF